MDKTIFLLIIFMLTVVDMLLTATAVVNFGAYENSWLHRWGFENFGYAYTGFGIILSFLMVLGISELGGVLVSYFNFKQKEYYFFVVYAGVITLYMAVIILNILVIYLLRK